MISRLFHFFAVLILFGIGLLVFILVAHLFFKAWNKLPLRPALSRTLARLGRGRLGFWMRKIQLQMIVVFGLSALAFLLATHVSGIVVGQVISSASIDYSNSVSQLNSDTEQISSEITNPTQRPTTGVNYQKVSIQQAINDFSNQQHEQIYIINPSGKVLIASNNADTTQVNMQTLIGEAANTTLGSNYQGGTIVRMDPLTYLGSPAYVVVQGVPVPNMVYTREANPLSTVIGLAAFLLTFYQLTKRKVRYIQELGRGLHEIALGKLDFRVIQRGSDELATLAQDINHTAQALQQQLEAERLAEKTKNELITNVSHDLRTPLTLVSGYLRLLKDRKFADDQQYDQFVTIAHDKSEQLSTLIENLFEYTKLSNQGVPFNYQDISINELLGQVVEELVSVAEQVEIHFIREMPDESLFVHVDATQMSRVFENLLGNSIQHSLKPSEVHVRLQRQDPYAVITVANQGNPIPADELPHLFDRFYRGDHARTTAAATGGSGLGLAIAKSIVDLHQGSIHAECEDTEIRFVVKLPLVTGHVPAYATSLAWPEPARSIAANVAVSIARTIMA